MDFTWVKRKDCKVLLQDSTLVGPGIWVRIGVNELLDGLGLLGFVHSDALSLLAKYVNNHITY
jgi:hypothetical protein